MLVFTSVQDVDVHFPGYLWWRTRGKLRFRMIKSALNFPRNAI